MREKKLIPVQEVGEMRETTGEMIDIGVRLHVTTETAIVTIIITMTTITGVAQHHLGGTWTCIHQLTANNTDHGDTLEKDTEVRRQILLYCVSCLNQVVQICAQ